MTELQKLKKPVITGLIVLIVMALIIKIGLWIASMLGFFIIALALVILVPIAIKAIKKYKPSLPK